MPRNNLQQGFVHSVYFYLNEAAEQEQVQKLIDDCKNLLGSIKTVRNLWVGTSAGVPREVVDNSYGVSLIVFFDDEDGHDYYRQSEEHMKFIERNNKAWKWLRVYDMLPA
jgi:hypothetical protein